jgi:hypothetical protein
MISLALTPISVVTKLELLAIIKYGSRVHERVIDPSSDENRVVPASWEVFRAERWATVKRSAPKTSRRGYTVRHLY